MSQYTRYDLAAIVRAAARRIRAQHDTWELIKGIMERRIGDE